MQGVGGVDVGAPDLSFLNSLNVSPSGGTTPAAAASEQVGNPVPGNSVAANPLPATSSPFTGTEQLPATSLTPNPNSETGFTNAAGQAILPSPPADVTPASVNTAGNAIPPPTADTGTPPNVNTLGATLDSASAPGPLFTPNLPDISQLPYVPPTPGPAVTGPSPFNMGGFMNWFGGIQPESQMQIARAMQSWLARQGA